MNQQRSYDGKIILIPMTKLQSCTLAVAHLVFHTIKTSIAKRAPTLIFAKISQKSRKKLLEGGVHRLCSFVIIFHFVLQLYQRMACINSLLNCNLQSQVTSNLEQI